MTIPSAAEAYRRGWRAGWASDDPISVPEWAELYRILEIGREIGLRWDNARVPYLNGPMEALSAEDPHEVVALMFGAQMGKTAAAQNWLGHAIHISPAPILVAYPTREGAQMFVRQRFDPMIAATPELKARMAVARSRDRGNTLRDKDFVGGVIAFRGANSPAGLRSMPVKRLFLDEVDSFPGELEDEGDPVQLAITRTTTYPDRKILVTSTPTARGFSKIEKLFLRSDRRRYFIPCLECGHADYLTWQGHDIYGDQAATHHRIVWTDGKPETAAMACSRCGCVVDERFKNEMLAAGEWIPTAPGDGKTAGFHASALYTPEGWMSWAEYAEQFIDAGDDPSKLKPFVQLVLAETWQDEGQDASPEDILERARRENYAADVPNGVGALMLAVDVHPDRLEWQVTGYGAAEESWVIAKDVLRGDPGDLLTGKLGADLEELVRRRWTHESGQIVPIDTTVIDSGGSHTDEVYQFCAARWRRHVWAIRGGSHPGKEIVSKPSRNHFGGPLWTIGVDSAKDTVMSRLRIRSPGPGYMHIPSHIATEEYAAQLTAERAVRVLKKGRGWVRVWKQTRRRNEVLDLTVYSLAALHICGPDFMRRLGERAKRLAVKVDGTTPKRPEPKPQETAQAQLLRQARERALRIRKTGRRGWGRGFRR